MGIQKPCILTQDKKGTTTAKSNIIITRQKTLSTQALEFLLFFIVCLKDLKDPQGIFREIFWHSLPAELPTFECVVLM